MIRESTRPHSIAPSEGPDASVLLAALEAVGDHALVYDRQHRCLFASPSALHAHRIRLADVLGKTPSESALPVEFSSRIDNEIEHLFTTGIGAFGSLRHPTPTGEREFEYSVTPVRTSGDPHSPIVGAVYCGRDVTDRVRAEQAAFDSQESFRATFDDAPIGIAQMAPDGRYLRVNCALCGILGYSETELLAMDFRAITHPDDFEPGETMRRRILAGELAPYTIEKRYIRKDGRVIWCNVSVALARTRAGGVAYTITMVEEITERKEAEDSVRILEERQRLAIEGANIGTWHWDLRADTMVLSERARALLGLEQDAPITYTGFLAHVHDDDREIVDAAMVKSIAERTEYDLEYRIITATGHLRWIAAKGQCYYDPRGEALRFEGIVQDIDARKRAETRLDDTIRELDAALSREHNIAATLQRSLLQVTPEATFAGLSVESIYEPAVADLVVGGDFLDMFCVAERQVALVIGDVSGKGLGAAKHTAEIKYALRAYLRETPDPATALSRLNAYLCRSEALGESGLTGFVCISVAVADTRTGEVLVASAGTEPPFVVRGNGETQLISAGGMPIGVMAQSSYENETLTLRREDLLIMVTDGLTEARMGANGFFGIDGCASLAAQLRELPSLRQIATMLVAGAKTYANGILADDACALIARLAWDRGNADAAQSPR